MVAVFGTEEERARWEEHKVRRKDAAELRERMLREGQELPSLAERVAMLKDAMSNAPVPEPRATGMIRRPSRGADGPKPE